jgi:hypothetical protein
LGAVLQPAFTKLIPNFLILVEHTVDNCLVQFVRLICGNVVSEVVAQPIEPVGFQIGHGAEVGLCGVFVFVDQAAQDGSACDLFVVAVGDGVVWAGRAELATAVESSIVVVSGVGRQDGSRVSFAEDQHTGGEFSSGGEHESLGEAVRSGLSGQSKIGLAFGPG